MKINKVKLHNFSSYEGNNEFDFEITDAGKNIVLIGGKNGAGKTSLFTAIKVALYGPLAYGYVGVNSHYISKIKDLINSKAFQQEVVESEVQLTLQLKIERDIRNYVITRKWDYTNQKLTEEYTVARDGKLLNDQELSYFENYLRSIIPPDLFEFFLFDGEEVGNIFSTSAYNTYVRNAVFTMCGMDVFEIIRKFTRGYVTKNNSNDDDEVYDTYESAKQQIETLETEKENLDVEVGNLTKELENIDIQLTELATAFKNAGGISRKEKKQANRPIRTTVRISTRTPCFFFIFLYLFFCHSSFYHDCTLYALTFQLAAHFVNIIDFPFEVIGVCRTAATAVESCKTFLTCLFCIDVAIFKIFTDCRFCDSLVHITKKEIFVSYKLMARIQVSPWGNCQILCS